MFVVTHLKSLQALQLALRCGSLKGAAQQLAITPAAVGQRVKALEDYLGMQLLVRGRSGLQPTAALAQALAHLDTGFRELQAVGDLLDMQRSHEIHIAAAPDFAEMWLQPRLDQFKQLYPNIRFCINGEGEATIRLAPVDCEISFGPRRAASGSDMLLFRDFVVPIASPEIAQRLLRVAKRERLEGFPLLHLDFYKDDPQVPNWSAWIRQRRLKRTAPNRGIRFQRTSRALEAVLANAGLTLCGLALISAAVDNDSVSMPFPMNSGIWSSHAFQARLRVDAPVRPQVRQFREWLLKESRLTEQWLLRLAGQGRRSGRPAAPTRA
ncbi:MAG TPA: LysR substrate-binding domain-containing protein [Steroidobacteraceae bacterium]|jgi:LysR family glycine cleavage system transcriptional activator|nr:LysR substrate-binding domain-containing protein [Steroidobacteraceae bacterium]